MCLYVSVFLSKFKQQGMHVDVNYKIRFNSCNVVNKTMFNIVTLQPNEQAMKNGYASRLECKVMICAKKQPIANVIIDKHNCYTYKKNKKYCKYICMPKLLIVFVVF